MFVPAVSFYLYCSLTATFIFCFLSIIFIFIASFLSHFLVIFLFPIFSISISVWQFQNRDVLVASIFLLVDRPCTSTPSCYLFSRRVLCGIRSRVDHFHAWSVIEWAIEQTRKNFFKLLQFLLCLKKRKKYFFFLTIGIIYLNK